MSTSMSMVRSPSKDRRVEPTTTPPAAPRRAISEEVAQVAQHVIDLEDATKALHADVESWKHQCSIARHENEQLKRLLKETTAKMEYYQRRTAEVTSKLQTAGKIVLDCLEEGPVGPYRPNGAAKLGVAAVEDELAENEVPSIVAAGPRRDETPKAMGTDRAPVHG
jgi:regulator of replication initiation timing